MPGLPGFEVLRLISCCFGAHEDGAQNNARRTTTSQHEKSANMSEPKHVEAARSTHTTTELKSLAQDAIVTMSRLKRASYRWRLAETQNATERQKYIDKRRFVEESILELSDEALCGEGVIDAAVREQLRGDSEALRIQSVHLMKMEQEATILATRLNEASTAAWTAFTVLIQMLPDGAAMLEEIQQTPTDLVSRESPVSSVLPALAREYFDAVADNALLHERLTDLDARYEEESQLREAAKEQDRPSEQPDAEFEALHTAQRAQLLSKLQDGDNCIDALYAKCKEADIDVEKLQHRRAPGSQCFDALPPSNQVDELFLPSHNNALMNECLSAMGPHQVESSIASVQDIQTWLEHTTGPDQYPPGLNFGGPTMGEVYELPGNATLIYHRDDAWNRSSQLHCQSDVTWTNSVRRRSF